MPMRVSRPARRNVRPGPSRRRGGGGRSRPAVQPRGPVAPVEAPQRTIEISESITVKDLAERMMLSPVEILKQLIKSGIMANINQVVDRGTAVGVARELGFEVEETVAPTEERALPNDIQVMRDAMQSEKGTQSVRPPVVTIMGHVDHGKTSLLDVIRHANVTAQEAGGITQHIGAYQAEIHGQKITFLDTPGHEAFTAMRARGAQVTDIAVLVVAADDGVMPQTVEAINHAKAAGVPIVVAINKIDKPNANADRVKQELTEHGVVIEEWGGEVPCVAVSAKREEGIEDLLENILVVAEIGELKANPDRPALGAVVEAKLDKSRGPVATVLVRAGSLRQGDWVVVGETYGHIKAMFNDRGRRVKKVGPSTPVEILGLNTVPQAGDTLEAVPDEKAARQAVVDRTTVHESKASAAQVLSLDDLYGQMKAGALKELNVVLKTDVQGSIEPIKASLERLENENLRVRVLHTGAGTITESDVMLAIASKGIIIGFNTRVEPGAKRMADTEGVDVRLYQIIYELVDDVKKALVGMLEPKVVEIVDGHAEVRQVFRMGKRDAIAGSYVLDGKITRSNQVRVLRGGEAIFDGRIGSLKRFKDDAREVAAGYECGIGLEGFTDFQTGDIIEAYRKEKERVSG